MASGTYAEPEPVPDEACRSRSPGRTCSTRSRWPRSTAPPRPATRRR
nr:hypothetical protein [Angustibacter aerolatus]